MGLMIFIKDIILIVQPKIQLLKTKFPLFIIPKISVFWMTVGIFNIDMLVWNTLLIFILLILYKKNNAIIYYIYKSLSNTNLEPQHFSNGYKKYSITWIRLTSLTNVLYNNKIWYICFVFNFYKLSVISIYMSIGAQCKSLVG